MWINADLGEGCAGDEALFRLVDWANIACGGHAGDEDSMQLACSLALQYSVQAGAHPSYPDRAGFGRRKPVGAKAGLLDSLKHQVEQFENIASRMGCFTRHLKPHGQLYNDAAFQQAEAEVLFQLMHAFPHLQLVALAQSPLVDWFRTSGLEVIEEAFPDRAYLSTGALAPRSMAGAVILDPEQVRKQARSLVHHQPLVCLDEGLLQIQAHTLCVHGDTPQALANAIAVRQAVNDTTD